MPCHVRVILLSVLATVAAALGFTASARAADTVNIAVIAPVSTPPGQGFIKGAQLAAAQINSSGGVDGRHVKLFVFDTHSSSSEAALAFQRAVSRDHVVAATGIFNSEVAFVLAPWSTRLKTPLLLTGSTSVKIPKLIHADYDKYKYTFQMFMNTDDFSRSACEFAKSELVDKLHYKSAAILIEDAAWTKPYAEGLRECLPKAGLKVVGTVRYDLGTSDFTPVFDHLDSLHPDVIITGFAHSGLQTVIQWHALHVPALLVGLNAIGEDDGFWKATNGAASGEIIGTVSTNGAALTDKTPAFYKAYVSRFHQMPIFSSYSTYDAIYVVKDALERMQAAKQQGGEALLTAIANTHFVGAGGIVQFTSKEDALAHTIKYVPGVTSGVYFQWQNGKQVVIWPARVAAAQIVLPSYIKERPDSPHHASAVARR